MPVSQFEMSIWPLGMVKIYCSVHCTWLVMAWNIPKKTLHMLPLLPGLIIIFSVFVLINTVYSWPKRLNTALNVKLASKSMWQLLYNECHSSCCKMQEWYYCTWMLPDIGYVTRLAVWKLPKWLISHDIPD